MQPQWHPWDTDFFRPGSIQATLLSLLLGLALLNPSLAAERQDPSVYQHKATRDPVGVVNDAAELFAEQGEKTFDEFSRPGSRCSPPL